MEYGRSWGSQDETIMCVGIMSELSTVENQVLPLETQQKPHIETHAGQSSRFSMKLVYENFFEALARLKGLWSMHGLP